MRDAASQSGLGFSKKIARRAVFRWPAAFNFIFSVRGVIDLPWGGAHSY
jgi:hypothetical protein